MIVISDTGPIITLLKAGCIELLKDIFGEVIIPVAVYEELIAIEGYDEEKKIIKDADYIWVNSSDVSEETKRIQVNACLDFGESAALALAERLNPDYMLIEDAKARRYAEEQKINVIGSLAILIMSYKKGLLSKGEVYNITQKMKRSGRHISEKLYLNIYKTIELEDKYIEKEISHIDDENIVRREKSR